MENKIIYLNGKYGAAGVIPVDSVDGRRKGNGYPESTIKKY